MVMPVYFGLLDLSQKKNFGLLVHATDVPTCLVLWYSHSQITTRCTATSGHIIKSYMESLDRMYVHQVAV
jgi:hypothetical protein